MKIEVFDGNWNVKDVVKNKSKIFVFGDNDHRMGKKGQAIIRDCENTIGLRTKKYPSYRADSYYNDREHLENRKKIIEDVKQIKEELFFGKTIVFASGGYGTGLSDLKNKSPKTWNFLCDILLKEFNYDNENGKLVDYKYSKDDLEKFEKIPMNYEHNKIGFGQEMQGFFRKELLDNNIFSTFDAIKKGYRTATTRTNKYKSGQHVLFTKSGVNEMLLCKIIKSSYIVSSISKEEWSLLEGWDISYFDRNPILDKFQFVYKLISVIKIKDDI